MIRHVASSMRRVSRGSFAITLSSIRAPMRPMSATLAVAMSRGYVDPHSDILLNIVAAGSLLYILPVLVIFFFAQRSFVRGIVTSGLKG